MGAAAKTDNGRGLLFAGDALEAYAKWPAPDCIISDGGYGVGGFMGDPRTPEELPAWYAPHVQAWSRHAKAATTLWLWNTEVGWANVHPLLVANGWRYEETIIWDKGISHIAGNVNSQTIRRFPTVTEICVHYTRQLVLPTESGSLPVREWMRHEWRRSGLPLRHADLACGVKNAASRKYLATDWLWYFPPPDKMEKLARHANEHGEPTKRPYYSLDGEKMVTASEWAKLRHAWHHRHALTNVWSAPPVHGLERIKGTGKRSAPRVHQPTLQAAAHLNQKPLEFMRRIIEACTDPGDVVWEPFGGLCTATVAARELGRQGFAAEIDEGFREMAQVRLETARQPA
jgi:site-specific DNA-methyltransferase (adenine-specific)